MPPVCRATGGPVPRVIENANEVTFVPRTFTEPSSNHRRNAEAARGSSWTATSVRSRREPTMVGSASKQPPRDAPPAVQVTVVESEACHFCVDAAASPRCPRGRLPIGRGHRRRPLGDRASADGAAQGRDEPAGPDRRRLLQQRSTPSPKARQASRATLWRPRCPADAKWWHPWVTC